VEKRGKAPSPDDAVNYNNKNVLITGGLGFIGSNLAIRLVEQGARVTIVDPSIEGCGANPYNIEPVRQRLKVIPVDIANTSEFSAELAHSEIVFNLAGEISHIHSIQFPERDLHINVVSQLQFLEGCKRLVPGVRIVYAGTRQVYGSPNYLPVDENHPVQPVDFNGVHKCAAMMYPLLLTHRRELDAIVLRLTNVYGPRMALDVPCQGFLNTFLRRLVLGQPLEVFGDGEQLRDPVYIGDVVEAFLTAGAARLPPSRVYNVGGPEALPLKNLAETATRAAGCAEIRYRPFPAELKSIDIGSFSADSKRIAGELGWQARVPFTQGIMRTLEYYRKEWTHYVDAENTQANCKMPEHRGRERRLILTTV
jgi:nucleoside-diphosphate-sugar epimerase